MLGAILLRLAVCAVAVLVVGLVRLYTGRGR